MRIYVASKWQDREIIKQIQKDIELAGHSISYDWTDHSFDPVAGTKKDLERLAVEDIQGVINADLLIVYAVFHYSYEGAFCEMGAALALGKPIYVVGYAIDSCIFINHPLVKQFETVMEAITNLSEVKR